MIKRYLVTAALFTLLAVGLKADSMPVKLTFRPSLMIRETFVAQFRNEGDKNLMLHAEFDRADGSAKKSFTVFVPANQLKEIGRRQGWVVKSGDQLTVTSEGYDDIRCHMP